MAILSYYSSSKGVKMVSSNSCFPGKAKCNTWRRSKSDMSPSLAIVMRSGHNVVQSFNLFPREHIPMFFPVVRHVGPFVLSAALFDGVSDRKRGIANWLLSRLDHSFTSTFP